MSKKNALGRGLNALLPDSEMEFEREMSFFSCPVDAIYPNPFQPRKEFNAEGLDELADSIREKGLIQPLIVLKENDGRGGYFLIAGERRLRASKMAGLTEVPVIVKDVPSEDLLELALIENIQRQDLHPLEEAEAYSRLIDEFNLTQEEIARRVGKERSTVTNTLRLLKLPDFVKHDLFNGSMSAGHARVLLGFSDNETVIKAIRDEIVAHSLSVRQAEALAKKHQNGEEVNTKRTKKQPAGIPQSFCRTLNNALFNYLGTNTRIVQNGLQGKLEISYKSADDLDRILRLILKNAAFENQAQTVS